MKIKKTNVKKSKKAGNTELKCDYFDENTNQKCSYSTRFKEHLSSHMQSHSQSRDHVCDQCGQTFKWSHSLKRHQRTHSSVADYK